jgi:hypothetical protein
MESLVEEFPLSDFTFRFSKPIFKFRVSIPMTAQGVLSRLKRLANPANVRGMAHFAITSKNVLGIPGPE